MSDINKIYPATSNEVAQLLGLQGTSVPEQATSAFPGNLPILETEAKEVKKPTPELPGTTSEMEALEFEPETTPEEQPAETKSQATKLLKTIAPYVIIFALGLFLYYFFFSDFSFSTLFQRQTQVASAQKDSALEELKQTQTAAYQAWISQFYFDVSDQSIIDPDRDNSGNGLTNFQKYLLGLNPKAYDTLDNDMPDGALVVQGTDPTTGQPFSPEKQRLIENYFDLEVISNRMLLDTFQQNQPQSTITQPALITTASAEETFVPITSPSFGSNPAPRPTNTVQTAVSPSTRDGANSLGINTNVPARLIIPSLNIDAPIIFTKNTTTIDKDLRRGVIHLPGTALPGDIGTSYISGHSSNLTLLKNPYNKIFTNLGDLKDLASFKIIVTLTNGRQSTLHYVVTRRGTFKPNDQAQFANTAESVVALSTCWPPGTSADRLVVFGKLTQTEN
jgi:LPXTG-site transpeptidase (sortase) family protein